MKVYDSEKTINSKYTGVGLGNFDGLHVGHMALITTLINESDFMGLDSVIYTFDKHPEHIMRKGLVTPLITTRGKKVDLLSKTALDGIYFDEFDEEFSHMPPDDFINKILIGKLNIKLAVTGFDYRFGYKGAGDAHYLKKKGEILGFKTIIIPPIKVNNHIVSSTLIRNIIKKGCVNDVFKYLGRHYSINGIVKRGKRLGTKMGFPTANIYPENYLIYPTNGVYITKTLLDGEMYYSISNIGANPTIKEYTHSISLETHLLDFDEDIYDKNIEVFFIEKIRNEKKFKSIEQLKQNIANDVKRTKSFFEINGKNTDRS
jgi:riboflavin kinase/FMN adenylyltransferase